MIVTRQTVSGKIAAYLRNEISAEQLIDWAEIAIMDGEFAEADLPVARDVVARLGLGDVRAFGLTWEDFRRLLRQLGYSAQVDVVAA